jgi:hypothetical protein
VSSIIATSVKIALDLKGLHKENRLYVELDEGGFAAQVIRHFTTLTADNEIVEHIEPLKEVSTSKEGLLSVDAAILKHILSNYHKHTKKEIGRQDIYYNRLYYLATKTRELLMIANSANYTLETPVGIFTVISNIGVNFKKGGWSSFRTYSEPFARN